MKASSGASGIIKFGSFQEFCRTIRFPNHFPLFPFPAGGNSAIMKSLFRFIIIFSFFSSQAFGQSDFRSGFIVTFENDTTYGKIDYQSNARNYQLCRFKEDKAVITYTPQQIAGFGYIGDKFFTSSVLEDSFVEVLVGGELNLYKFRNFFFVKKRGEEVHPLKNETIVVELDGKKGLKKDRRWRGILISLISDCLLEVNSLVNDIKFQEKSLTQLVIRYNECKGSNFTVYKGNKLWTKVDYGAIFGLTGSTIKVITPYGHFSYLDDSYQSLDADLGLVISISSPRISEKVSIQPEVHFIRSTFSALVIDEGISRRIFHDTFIGLTTLSVPIFFKYSLPVKANIFNVHGGIVYDYHIKATTRKLTETVRGKVVETSESPAFGVRHHQLGFGAGIGIIKSFNKFKGSAVIRYFQMSNLDISNEVDVINNRIAFSIILSRK